MASVLIPGYSAGNSEVAEPALCECDSSNRRNQEGEARESDSGVEFVSLNTFHCEVDEYCCERDYNNGGDEFRSFEALRPRRFV